MLNLSPYSSELLTTASLRAAAVTKASNKKLGVLLDQTESRKENSGFVSAPRVVRIKAVLPYFAGLDDCGGAAGKQHVFFLLPTQHKQAHRLPRHNRSRSRLTVLYVHPRRRIPQLQSGPTLE